MSTEKLPTFELIDRLNLLISSARPIPLSGKLMIDRDEINELTRKLEESIPADLNKARKLLSLEKQIIDQSKQQADDMTREAAQNAKSTVESATRQANALTAEAQSRASETVRAATEQANAMLADAQNQRSAMLQDAQNQARQMVSESEIIARAQAEAQEIRDTTHRECEEYSMRVSGAVSQMLEQADNAMAHQLDELRILRQEIVNHP